MFSLGIFINHIYIYIVKIFNYLFNLEAFIILRNVKNLREDGNRIIQFTNMKEFIRYLIEGTPGQKSSYEQRNKESCGVFKKKNVNRFFVRIKMLSRQQQGTAL